MNNKYFSTIILVPLLLASLYGYYANIAAMKGDGAVSSMRGALEYVESHWQEGDIIFTTDDGPWINLRPYTDRPIYRMPMDGCEERGSFAPVLGSLSSTTREALGMNGASLDEIHHARAWVFAPTRSPLHPNCYTAMIASLTAGTPVYVVDDGDWLYSAVWLVENK
jgi:hypothetical protein